MIKNSLNFGKCYKFSRTEAVCKFWGQAYLIALAPNVNDFAEASNGIDKVDAEYSRSIK